MLRHDQERALVSRLRAGDAAAVAEFAAAYGPKAYQLAFRHTRNREDAEEIAQDVLYKVYRKIGGFRGDSALSSWIYRITFNTIMSRLRTSKFSRPAEVSAEVFRVKSEGGRSLLPRAAADWSSLADDTYMRAELRARLGKAIGNLPPIYREPVLLRDIHGLSTEEASQRLRVNRQTFKSRLHRGRLFLRTKLADFSGGVWLRPAA